MTIKRRSLDRSVYPLPNTWRFAWQGITSADVDCEPVAIPHLSDRSVEVTGTFGGATVTIKGGASGTDFTLTDPQGNPLVFTAAGFKAIMENTWDVVPVITGATGTTDLTVAIVAKGSAS